MTMTMIARTCPVCGTNDRARTFAEAAFDPAKMDQFTFASRKLPEYMHYRLLTCGQCDLVYAAPAPSVEMLSGAYRDAAFDSGREAQFAARTYAAILQKTFQQFPDRVGALDIGTGDGAFLGELLVNGFTAVEGVEPSVAPRESAADHIRPLIRAGIFDGQTFKGRQYRLITCFQTIEHVYDPLQLCRDARGLLKRDGALALVFHNRRALSARILGRRSPIFDVEHLQLFSRASARSLLQTAGFRDIQIRVVYNRYPLGHWLKLFPFPAAIKKTILSTARRTRLERLQVALPAGNLLAVAFNR